jgi:hypothetical protein
LDTDNNRLGVYHKEQNMAGASAREPHEYGADITLLSQRIELMHRDFVEMKVVLGKLTDAILKLAVVEERQAEFGRAQERAFQAIVSLEGRTRSLEMSSMNATRTSMWVDRAVTAAVAVVLYYAASRVGLIP